MGLLDKKLEIFRMAATLRHFSEAAEALGMTQPNVTQQIARLEEEIGSALFVRQGRQVSLTPAGEALLAECNRLFATVSEVRRHVRNAAAAVRRYRIGGTMTAGGFVLPELAAAYMAQYADCNVNLHIANTHEISDLLKSRTLDLALVEGPYDEEYFAGREFLEDELIPVAAPGVLPPRFSLGEYLRDGGRLVLREPGSGTRYYFDAFCRRHGLELHREDCLIEVNNFDALKHLVRGRHGITVISELAVADELDAATLRSSRFTEGTIRRRMNFIYQVGENPVFAEHFIRFCRGRRQFSAPGH